MGAGLLLRLLYLYSWIDSGGRALSAGVAAYHVRFWRQPASEGDTVLNVTRTIYSING